MTATLSDRDLLARLVAFDSVSARSNLPVVDFLADYLDRPGVRVARNPNPEGTKANLIVTVGPAENPDRAGLTLSGHTDVVPADEPDWQSDAFRLVETDDRYLARGAADMKGFLALAANLVASLDPVRLVHPLALLFTFDEEVGTLGAKHFADTWVDPGALPRDTIIGEPTSLQVIRLHKGHATLRLTVEGVPAHSGYPHLGRNAIEPVGRAIVALAALGDRLRHEPSPHREFFPDVPFVPLNVGQVAGGSAVNVVPERCTLEFGLRLMPGMESGPMFARIRETLDAAVGEAYHLDILCDSPPFALPDATPFYRQVSAHVAQDETCSASYATDAGWLQTVGFDCVVWGPGSIEVAHKPNEAMPRAEFERGARLLQAVVHQRCLPT